MNLELSCSIESSRVIIGEPYFQVHQSLLSMDKYFKTTWFYLHSQIGLFINSRNLTLRTQDIKCQYLVKILLNTWNVSCKRFTLHEVASIFGIASNLALTTQWVKQTHISLQHIVFISLKFNSKDAFASGKHKNITCLLRSKKISIKIFFLSESHKTVWNSKEKFNIIKYVRAEINIFSSIATWPADFRWDIPIKHVMSIDIWCLKTVTVHSWDMSVFQNVGMISRAQFLVLRTIVWLHSAQNPETSQNEILRPNYNQQPRTCHNHVLM